MHEKITYVFHWKTSDGMTSIAINGMTYDHAVNEAKRQGYVEYQWYKPWTWTNHVSALMDIE